MQRKTIEQIAAEAKERFPDIEEYTDSSLMPFGAYKGEMMCDISDKYLQTVYDIMKPDVLLKAYIAKRLGIPSHLNGTGNMTNEELKGRM